MARTADHHTADHVTADIGGGQVGTGRDFGRDRVTGGRLDRPSAPITDQLDATLPDAVPVPGGGRGHGPAPQPIVGDPYDPDPAEAADPIDPDPILGPIEQFDVENAAYDDDVDDHRPALTGPRLAAVAGILLLIIGGIAFLARFRSDAEEGTSRSDTNPSVDLLARATVQIVGLDRAGAPLCSGSGTLVSNDGMILTNAHVVSRDSVCDFDSLGIAMTSDAGRPPDLLYGAELLALDAELDLAVLTVGAPLEAGVTGLTTFPAMALGDSDDLHIGDDLRILGYPEIGGETITFTNGSVSGFTAQAGIG
ncbi:MAG: serine protease, partial [Actinomycetota bacterium]